MITLTNTAGGIGDCIAGLYAAKGLSSRYKDVHYYIRNFNWLLGGEYTHTNANLTLLPADKAPVDTPAIDMCHDLKAHYLNASLDKYTRVQLYIRNVQAQMGLDDIAISEDQCQPEFSYHYLGNMFGGAYVVLCPFATSSQRQWPIVHFKWLAHHLAKQGVNIIVLADERSANVAAQNFGQYTVLSGCAPSYVISVLKHAKAIVSNDSGMAHLAILHGQRPIVVMAQLRGMYVYGSNAHTVEPAAFPCHPCYHQPDMLAPACNRFCSALYSISAPQVADMVMEKLTINS